MDIYFFCHMHVYYSVVQTCLLPVGWAVVALVKCIRRVNLFCSCFSFCSLCSFSVCLCRSSMTVFVCVLLLLFFFSRCAFPCLVYSHFCFRSLFLCVPVLFCNRVVAQFFIRLFSFCSWLTINWMMATKMKQMTECDMPQWCWCDMTWQPMHKNSR